MAKSTLVEENTRLQEAQAFLEERGILPDQDGYTSHQLTEELFRQGWGWTLDPERAEATKAYPPFPAAARTFVAEGPEPIANLMLVLADVVRFDEERGPFPVPPYEPDIVARMPNGRIVAAIEARNRKELSPDLAVAFRLSFWRYGLRALHVPFFIMVSQDAGYLWDQRSKLRADAPPTLAFSMKSVIERYASWLEPGEWLYKDGFELVVFSWLNDLADPHTVTPQPVPAELAETEFVELIQNARMTFSDIEA